MSKISKVINAMLADTIQEDNSDSYVYSLSSKEVIESLTDHFVADRLSAIDIEFHDLYKDQFADQYYEEFFATDNTELEEMYFDIFDVKIVIE